MSTTTYNPVYNLSIKLEKRTVLKRYLYQILTNPYLLTVCNATCSF